MQMLPLCSSARRMAILIGLVGAIDAAAAFLTAKPQLWCALIPAPIPIFTPLAYILASGPGEKLNVARFRSPRPANRTWRPED